MSGKEPLSCGFDSNRGQASSQLARCGHTDRGLNIHLCSRTPQGFNEFVSCIFIGEQSVGVWTVMLTPTMFGGPYRIEAYSMVNGKMTTIVLDDIMFGDVWMCSGQSNMEFTVVMVD